MPSSLEVRGGCMCRSACASITKRAGTGVDGSGINNRSALAPDGRSSIEERQGRTNSVTKRIAPRRRPGFLPAGQMSVPRKPSQQLCSRRHLIWVRGNLSVSAADDTDLQSVGNLARMTKITDDHTYSARVGAAARASGWTVGAAESVTAGQISSGLAAAEGAAEWFRGALVAYSKEVKFAVLGVEPGPVVNAGCAQQMAEGAAKLLDADFVVSTTGAGGPGTEEGQPAGTVFIAVLSPTMCSVTQYHFNGDPESVVHTAAEQALHDLADTMERYSALGERPKGMMPD